MTSVTRRGLASWLWLACLESFLLQAGRLVSQSPPRCRLLASSPLCSEATVVQPRACLSQLPRYSSLVARVGLGVYDDEPKPTVSEAASRAGHTSVPCVDTRHVQGGHHKRLLLDTLSHMLPE